MGLRRIIESWEAVFCFTLAFLICLYIFPKIEFNEFKSILSNAITCLSVLVGFVSASLSILLSIKDTDKWLKAKSIELDLDLINYHWSGIRWCFGALLISFCDLFISSIYDDYSKCIVALTLGLYVGSATAFYRTASLTVKFLKI